MDTKKLQELGLNDEQIKAVMSDFGEEHNALKNAVEELKEQNEELKQANSTYETQVKELTDNKSDAEELTNKIETLQEQIKENERKEADKRFNAQVESILKENNALDNKSVMAHLDMENLKASKNQNEDIKKAIDDLKADKSFLFKNDEPINNINLGATNNEPPKDTEGLQKLQNAFGLKGKE